MRTLVLLRGINLGAVNRVPMAELREALTEAGFSGPDGGAVKTYLQSGNVALDSAVGPDELARIVEELVADRFGVAAPTVARSAGELERLIEGNPFPECALESPKTYQVSFLSEPIGHTGRAHVEARAEMGDAVAVSGSGLEVYAWHPGGIHVSKLASQLNEKKLGVRVATARNWTSVLTCLKLLTS